MICLGPVQARSGHVLRGDENVLAGFCCQDLHLIERAIKRGWTPGYPGRIREWAESDGYEQYYGSSEPFGAS